MTWLVSLWHLKPFATIFQIYITAVLFIGRGNQSALKKNPLICRKSLAQFCHIILHRVHLIMNGFQTHNCRVVIGTDCTRSSIYNYHTITTTTNIELCYLLKINILMSGLSHYLSDVLYMYT